MTTSAYFLPGPNGEPPMFGTRESGAFAWEMTPKRSDQIVLAMVPWGEPGRFVWTNSVYLGPDADCALALCEKQAQAWIRSKDFWITIDTGGRLTVENMNLDNIEIPELNGSPDWLAVARWVHEQAKKS